MKKFSPILALLLTVSALSACTGGGSGVTTPGSTDKAPDAAVSTSEPDANTGNPSNPDPTEPETAPKESQGLKFELNTSRDGYYLTGIGSCTDSEIVVPESYKGLPVVWITSSAFADNDRLTGIVIPASVESIGVSAFENCTNLKNVTLSEGLEKIWLEAFLGCRSLTAIEIPSTVTEIDPRVFDGCRSLESIRVAEGNPVYHSTDNCLIETEEHVLIAGCKNSVIPDDGSVYSIYQHAFYGQDAIKEIVIPGAVISIGHDAFAYCTALTDVTLSEGVEAISECAFAHCESLTGITIPAGMSVILGSAFAYCDNLESITIAEGNTRFRSEGTVLFREDEGTTLVIAPKSGEIPADGSIKEIGYASFYGYTMTSVVIPAGVELIGYGAFGNCSALQSITIPDSVTEIDYFAFENCDALTDIYFGGTEEQWQKVSEKIDLSDQMTVHFGSAG